MTTPLERGEDVPFIAVKGGRVHILPPREDEQSAVFVRLGDIDGEMALSLALGTLVARCGTVIHQHLGGLQAKGWPVRSFPDDLLCARCYSTVPEDERDQLFERRP